MGLAIKKTQNDSQTSLIEDNQGLVYTIAMKIHRTLPVKFELDDLIGYGMLGLSEAAKAFKPSRGVVFSTFAYHRIRGAIYDGISEVSWMSRARYRRLVQQNRQIENAPAESGDRDTEQVLEPIPTMQALSETQQDGLEDDAENPDTVVFRQEARETLCLLVDKLPQVKNRLITMVYFEGQSLQFAADRLGISKSWASRLHAKTLTELAIELKQFA